MKGSTGNIKNWFSKTFKRQHGEDGEYMKHPRKRMTKKRKRKMIIAGSCIVILAAGSIVFWQTRKILPVVMADGAITVRSVNVSAGDISNSIVGSGNLTKPDAREVLVPAGIKVSEVLVESGETVQEGDTLAVLDITSIQSSLSAVQERLNKLDKELNDLSSTSDETITSYIAGRVKKIYASAGDSVLDTMVNNGALMLLSVDGLMAVDIETDTALSVDSSVSVVLSSGTTVTGTVAEISGSRVKITMTDNGTAYDEAVTVKDSDGNTLGTGNLYINQPVTVTGTSGTVGTIKVSENTSVSSGTSLLTITDVISTDYQDLMAERNELAGNMQNLLVLIQDNTIKATYSGTIETVNLTEGEVTGSSTGSANGSGVNMVSAGTSTSSTAGYLTAASTGIRDSFIVAATLNTGSAEVLDTVDSTDEPVDDSGSDTDDTNANDEQTVLTIDAETLKGLQVAAPVTGLVPQTDVSATAAYTGTVKWSPSAGTFKADTTYQAKITLKAKDGYEFAANLDKYDLTVGVENAIINSVEVSGQKDQLVIEVTFEKTAAENQANDQNNDQNNGNTGDDTSGLGNLTGNASGSGSALAGGSISGGSAVSGSIASGSAASGSTAIVSGTSTSTDANSSSTSSANADVYNETTAFTITPDDTMQISISVDELDVLSVSKGQEVEVTLDAVDGTYTGEVIEIADTASASGGVVSYTAKISIEKGESMLAGMSASATIIIEKKENIVTIPVSAVQEFGNRVFVYTEYNESEGILSGEVEIETGLSDGDSVEVLSGLSAGDTVYYQVISASSDSNATGMDFGGMDFGGMDFGNMGGGGMPDMGSGGMPDMGSFGGGNRPEGGMPGGQ